MSIAALKRELREKVDLKRRQFSPQFFKATPGGYGEGDRFLGVPVPHQRKVARKFHELELEKIEKLVQSPYHEERLTALIILTLRFEKSNESEKLKCVRLYKRNLKSVNNWDLVDTSAHKILGPYYLNRSRQQLYKWARSNDLWKKRIAVITTFHFIANNDFVDTFKICEILLHDDHDLIHKAVGWALREVGNRDLRQEEKFLQRHYKSMPRTALRYAIEKLPERRRQQYLKGRI